MRRLGLILFVAVVFGPVAALALDAVRLAASDAGPGALGRTVLTARHWALLARTLVLAACVAAADVGIGLVAATALARWRRGFRAWARWLVLALVVVPPYVHALAWTSAASAAASALAHVGLGLPALEGWLGAWWVEVMAYQPIAVGLALLALESVDEDLVSAARLSRPEVTVFARVTLPLAAPPIAAAGGLIFLLSLADYGVPALFQLNVYPLELYVHYSGGGPAAGALVLALPMLAVAAAAVAWSQAGLRDAVMKPLAGGRRQTPPPAWPGWFRTLRAVAVILVAAQILVPVVSLCAEARSWTDVTGAVSAARGEMATTLWIALAAGALCLPMAAAVARSLARGGVVGTAWWVLAIVPLAIPAPLVGIGLVAIWNRPGLDALYGTLAMPVLASLARFTSLAALVILAQQRRVDPLLLDAGRVFQRSRLRGWLRVRLPMRAPGLVAAGCLVAALAAGELGATLIVAPPGRGTLTMRIYSYLHYGASENVAGLCLVLAVATVAAVVGAAAALRAWSGLFPRASETQP